MEDPALEPDYNNLTTFFEVMAEESQGILDKHATIKTLSARLSSFSGMWTWKYGKRIDKNILRAVRAVSDFGFRLSL